MPGSSKSAVIENLKPVNVFYVWYTELCRRINTSPLSIVKPAKPKKETVLDFVGDRIKPEEWSPILNALQKDTSLHVIAIRSRTECEFLHDMDTEQKVRRMKRRFGAICTPYILKTLLKSISCCLKNSNVLTSLELDGLPVTKEYLQLLMQALEYNKTIKILSLKYCPIKDEGCIMLSQGLRFIANVEVLNLTGCSLSPSSTEYLAKLINYQQIKRYCECWHNSLRYEDPEIDVMCGLKRLTLNNNPNIGDEGLNYLLDVLTDDLWIKALDMQKCNITDNIASKLIDVVNYSRSLQIADFRHNVRLSHVTIDKILDILKKKQHFGYDCEYQWCLTTSTLPYTSSFHDTFSNNSDETSNVQKSKSAPLQQAPSAIQSTATGTLRRTKTIANIKRVNQRMQIIKPKTLNKETKNEVTDLNERLKEEMFKRKQIEQINQELQKKLEHIKSVGSTHNESTDKIGQCIEIIEKLGLKKDEPALPQLKAALEKPKIKINAVKRKKVNENGRIKPSTVDGKNGIKKSPVKFVFSPTYRDSAQNIFEKFMFNEVSDDDDDDECEIEESVDDVYEYYNRKNFKSESGISKILNDDEENLSDMTASNVSLLRFVEGIKSADENSDIASTSNIKETVDTSDKSGNPWVKVR